jgi:cardiolipin synthase
MAHFWALTLCTNYVLALAFVATVLRRRREPTAMMAWIFAILTLPGLGMLLYWLLGSHRLRRKVGRRRRRVAHLLGRLRDRVEQQAHAAVAPAISDLPEDLASIEQLGRRLADMPATGGNEVCILQEANATYAALEEALRAAHHHIHMEYYIWQPDQTGEAFRDLVIERARTGVQCRLLLDAVGCRRIRRPFIRPLLEAGVQVAFFLPLHPLRLRKRLSLHLRNHRKIVIVDGQVAFMGSQNIGDEYRGRLRHLSPWYDTHMRLSGPASLFLQQTFAEDWYMAARERLDSDAYFPQPHRPGRSVVQVLATGPDQSVSTLAQIMFAAVSSARSSIRIATPYFVPDLAVRLALAYACYRGVQVRLVLPSRSDSALALWAARSFYPELLEAGVEVHEYDGGVLHSKLVTVDDRWCMLGSANMDVRSFRLNFESTALIYDQPVAVELAQSIDRFCSRARRITARDVWQRRRLRQIGEGAARLFAPLL